MQIGSKGESLIKSFEGCEKKRPDGKFDAYPDPGTGGDPWTIGWGDTGPDVVPGLVITQAEADRRFADRLAREFEPGVLALLKQARSGFGSLLSAFEVMWPDFYQLGTVSLGRKPPLELGHGAYVLIETLGTDPDADQAR